LTHQITKKKKHETLSSTGGVMYTLEGLEDGSDGSLSLAALPRSAGGGDSDPEGGVTVISQSTAGGVLAWDLATGRVLRDERGGLEDDTPVQQVVAGEDAEGRGFFLATIAVRVR
jgi:hypothetical protein